MLRRIVCHARGMWTEGSRCAGECESCYGVTETAGTEEIVTETEAVEVTEETEMVAETEAQETGTEEADADSQTETETQGQEQAGMNPGLEAGDAQNGTAGGQTADGSYSGTENVYLDSSWEYADHTVINSGYAVLYTGGGKPEESCSRCKCRTWYFRGNFSEDALPSGRISEDDGRYDRQGATQAVAVSSGMTFKDGTAESSVTLRMAQILRDKLLAAGYDVLMVREEAMCS